MSRRSRTPERFAPVVYLVLVAFLAVAVLPSALRPPPDQATNSAALDPDAPPEDAEPDAIISSFQQAGSNTAGAQRSSDAEADTDAPAATTTTAPPPPEKQASRGLCFGDPPRQVESIYAGECKPAFVGDNGGSTHKNVTGDLVRVGFFHTVGMPPDGGPIPEEPTTGEGGALRTARVIQQYFNQRIETYGRKVQLVAIDQESRSDEDEKAAAARADEEYGIFASTHLDKAFCDELIRRDLICYNQNPFKDEVYAAAAGRLYSYQMGVDKNDQLAADFACRRLAGGTADHAGRGSEGEPRKFGVVYETGNGRTASDLTARLARTCGIEAVGFDVRDPTLDSGEVQNIAIAVAQLKSSGVTTVLFSAQIIATLVMMQQADASAYFPEWVVIGTHGIDINIIASTLPANQAEHLFGMSGWELPRLPQQRDCWAAYKTIDPNNDPENAWCDQFFHPLLQIMNGISNAGPRLDPETFQQGLFAYGQNHRPERYAIQGGYAPGDLSFIDKMGEIWWDPSASAPGGASGAFRWTGDGVRYGVGEIPNGPNPELFVSGIVQGGQ